MQCDHSAVLFELQCLAQKPRKAAVEIVMAVASREARAAASLLAGEHQWTPLQHNTPNAHLQRRSSQTSIILQHLSDHLYLYNLPQSDRFHLV